VGAQQAMFAQIPEIAVSGNCRSRLVNWRDFVINAVGVSGQISLNQQINFRSLQTGNLKVEVDIDTP
jgi:hypothetical protein